MKRNKGVDFLTAALLLGALLTATIYVVLGVALRPRVAQSSSEEEAGVNRWFYEEERLRSFGDYLDYRLFRHVDDPTIIVGEKDWLFETKNEESGYDYLLDYVGGCAYTEEQMARIADTLEERRALCREAGGDYLLAVIPNSMTVCDEYLPSYLGDASENTRLRVLTEFLEARGISCCLDLSESMEAVSAEGAPYNNTEDSINAYGAYAVYDGILSALGQSEGLLEWESIEFSTRMTEGKSLARRNGLERTIRNRTVSLTDAMTDGYRTEEVTEHCVCTTMTEQGVARTVVLELAVDWDRIQLMPFFSGTFQTVVYENRLTPDAAPLAYHRGDVLIQVIHESQLDLLLE